MKTKRQLKTRTPEELEDERINNLSIDDFLDEFILTKKINGETISEELMEEIEERRKF